MLFDRRNDPYELRNLAGREEYAKVQQRLERRLKQWMAKTDDPFDSGPRDPETGILKLGAEFNHEKWYRRG